MIERAGAGTLSCVLRGGGFLGPPTEMRMIVDAAFAYPTAMLRWSDPVNIRSIYVGAVPRYDSSERIGDDGRTYYRSENPVGRDELVLEPGGRIVWAATYATSSTGSSSLECGG